MAHKTLTLANTQTSIQGQLLGGDCITIQGESRGGDCRRAIASILGYQISTSSLFGGALLVQLPSIDYCNIVRTKLS
ncbi:hypothetical protein Lalb_Chr14g0366271 [Lupinus albus]|uniref:Uncharacterized protein n=1 Tax=Lupinus albus TaxID=3870 RepID=A0A6A4P9L0_LUPAL|nr:hypothetical protein Lalb_Chr14g0366271 [Lupinus albus]